MFADGVEEIGVKWATVRAPGGELGIQDENGFVVAILGFTGPKEDRVAELIASAPALKAERDAALQREAVLKAALEGLLEYTGEKCWSDHNGNCQAHGIQPMAECIVAAALRALGPTDQTDAQ
jgi:hypothetical protein